MKAREIPLLKEKVLKGMTLLIFRDFGIKIFGIVGQILLVRIVAPQFFGVFAVIAFITGIGELLCDLGLSQSVIQSKKEIGNVQINTIIVVKIALSFLIIALIILFFPLLKMFYHQLSYEHFYMIIIFSLIIPIKSVKNVLVSLLDRSLNFSQITKIDFSGVFTYFILAIALALKGFLLWNFILAVVIKELIELALTIWFTKWKPNTGFDLKLILKMLKFGIFLQVGNFIAFIERSIVPLVGRSLSSTALGYLSWGFSVAGLSNTLFDSYGRAAFAGMSRIQANNKLLSRAVSESIILLNIISFLFVVLTISYSFEFTFLFLSQIWLAAIPALYFFIASVFFSGGSISISHALLAKGRSAEVVLYSGIVLILQISLAFILTNLLGFIGIAIATFVGSFLQLWAYISVGRKFGIDASIFHLYFRPTVVFVLVLFASYSLNVIIPIYSIQSFLPKLIGSLVLYIYLVRVMLPYEYKKALYLFARSK